MTKTRILSLLPALIGIGFAGFANAGGLADTAAPFQCGVASQTERGMLAIEGVVLSGALTEGAYQLRVASAGPSGRATIQQGGYFTALPDQVTTLGRVSVNATASHDIKFEIAANGRTFVCDAPVEVKR